MALPHLTQHTYTLSPLIMYRPSGIISTPLSLEYSRSTLSDKIKLQKLSLPFSLPCE